MSAQSDSRKNKSKIIKLSAAYEYRAKRAKDCAGREADQQDETVVNGVPECRDGVCSITWKPQRPAA